MPKFSLKEIQKRKVNYGENINVKETKEYYIIHDNGGRSMVVDVNRRKKKLRVFEAVANEAKELKNGQRVIVFKNYTRTQYSAEGTCSIYCHPDPVFETRFSKLFVGHDVNPDNRFIKNPLFGLGNSLLFRHGRLYYLIKDTKIKQLKGIKGRVTGYVSEIGNNDVPYPMIFTTTHLYAACDDFSEFPLPEDKWSRDIMTVLKNVKSPHDIPKSTDQAIYDFTLKYQCYWERKNL